jgi:uncharacterized cupredoxin-like copper-binding protein
MKKTSLALAFLFAACSTAPTAPTATDPAEGEALVVNVILTEFAVEMDQTNIPPGTLVIFRIRNEGSIDHNLILETSGAIDEPLVDLEGNSAKIVNMNPGETTDLRFVFEQNAEYGIALQLGCHLPGHYEAGMIQEFSLGN